MATNDVVAKLYGLLATVTVTTSAPNAQGIMKRTKKVLLNDAPCRISHSKVFPALTHGITTYALQVKLIGGKEFLNVPAGAEILIKDKNNDIVKKYTSSGSPLIFLSHVEIALDGGETHA